MSYNAGQIEVLKWENVRIRKADLDALLDDDKAEGNFLDEHEDCEPDANGLITLRQDKLWWYGEGSGNTWDHFIEDVATKILGTVEAIVTWEDGESHSGLRIRDGKVTEPKVVMALAEDA